MGLLASQGSQFDKPNRIRTPESEKNKAYHARFARFSIASSAHSGQYSRFVNKTRINKLFYMGGDNQWQFDEDVEAFLKDDTGKERNRIKVVNNMIRPLVEQFRGNANILKLNASVKSISERSITRKEMSLREQLFNFNLTFEMPAFADLIRQKFPIGQTVEQTVDIHNNLYVDKYVEAMNKLLDYSQELNRFLDMQIKAAEHLALSGLVVSEGFEHGGHLNFELVEPEEFFFDNTAKKPDLTDADFMGRAMFMNPTDIYERWQPSAEDANLIERFVELASAQGNQTHGHDTNLNRSILNSHVFSGAVGIKVPVFKVYWRDVDVSEWGYVESQLDQEPKLVRINHINEVGDGPEFTDQDLIEPPKTVKNKKLFKGKKKRKLYSDVIRYATLITSDIIASVARRDSDKKQARDIVLDFGLYEYQEVELQNPSNVKFPFKCQTWAYIDGEILSPVDDAISPQRLVNRVLSATESHINNSGGAGPVLDQDTVDPQDAKDGTIARDMKQGNPIFVRTKGRGVPNSIGTYDTTFRAGAQMFEIIPILSSIIKESTGVNDPLQGQPTGPDQLVGVTNALIQRGSIIQEPFYKAIELMFTQMHQMIATVGKRIYIENQIKLVSAVGNESAEVINLSEDMLLEEFRAFVKRDSDDETLQQQADQLLNILFQTQLIGEDVFANLVGRSKPDDVLRALRQSVMIRAEANRLQAEAEQAQTAEAQDSQDAALLLTEQEQLRQEGRQDQTNREKNQTEIDKAIVGAIGKNQNQSQGAVA